MQSIGGVVLIRWLQSALIPISTAQSAAEEWRVLKPPHESNEITAIPELLDLLDLKGMIITIDAMGCQKKIVEKIAEKKAEYVISLKGNQQSIHRDVKEFFEHPCDDAYCQCYHIQRGEYTIEIGHGRIEKRTCYLCGNINLE